MLSSASSHYLRRGHSSILFFRTFLPGCRTPSRAFSNTYRISQQSPLPEKPNQPTDNLNTPEWPEENLSATADEGAGFYPVRLGETFDDSRFVVTRKLGWGGYSSVWLARDRKEDRHVALKILTAHATSKIEAGWLRERDLLRKVTTASPLHHGFSHVIHLSHEFKFESFLGQHICFVMDVLSYSIPGLQKFLSTPPLPLKSILRIAKHVLKGLEYLHDECDVIHSDLKPANILLLPSDTDKIVMHELAEVPNVIYGFPKTIPPHELPSHPVVSCPLVFDMNIIKGADPKFHWVIADLGHSHPKGEHLSDMVQPYALRAPEVLLGVEWGPAIDIWSLGCIMYELATNRWLFRPKTVDDIPRDVDHLALMTKRTGQDHDDAILKQYETREEHQDLKGMLKRAIEKVPHIPLIESELTESKVFSNGAEEVADFVRIMKSLLILDPARRPRAAEVLLDPAFKNIP